MGVVSPLGCDIGTFWDRLTAGQSGIKLIDKFDTSNHGVKIAGQVVDFDADAFMDTKEQRRMDEFCHYALAASQLAVDDSGLLLEAENMDRVGVVVGSGIGGLQTLEVQHNVLLNRGPRRCSPFMIPQMILNMAAGVIAIRHGCKGPNYSVVSACATAAHCIGEGVNIIRRDDADVIVAGGSEAAVCPLGIAGFNAMKALSTRNDEPQQASRPFDAERDGFVMGEGGAIVILEELERARARGATIYCEVGGFGMTCDAFHMTAPAETGEGAARAMKLAIADAGMNPEDVDYVNAHGTSTPLNDKIETRAIKAALGEDIARKVMISSSKSMTGHMLGAAGGIESVACALAIHKGVVPPTINQEKPDPECDLDYVPNTAREADVKVCLNNSLGFGGHNACVLFKSVD